VSFLLRCFPRIHWNFPEPGTATALAFPPLAQPETAKGKNPTRLNPEDHQTGEKPMAHPVVHFEMGCPNSAKTQELYKQLFDGRVSDLGPAAMIAAESDGLTATLLRWATSRSTTRFFTLPSTTLPRISRKQTHWAQRRLFPRGYSHRYLRVDAGSRKQHRRPVERQVLVILKL
jgi:hypothetical protein